MLLDTTVCDALMFILKYAQFGHPVDVKEAWVHRERLEAYVTKLKKGTI